MCIVFYVAGFLLNVFQRVQIYASKCFRFFGTAVTEREEQENEISEQVQNIIYEFAGHTCRPYKTNGFGSTRSNAVL